jgi:hypothetical protein
MLKIPEKQEFLDKIYKNDKDLLDFIRLTYKSILINS